MIVRDCRIRIDKEGNWFYNQSPITNRNVCLYLSRHISMDHQGNYILKTANQTLPLEVEETPFVVKHCSIINMIPATIKVLLNDATEETVAWNRIWLRDDSQIYCTVKDGAFAARFNRDSQFELGDHLEFDRQRMLYYLTVGHEKFYLAVRPYRHPD